ncbi:hypothetical protein quinque_002409 [Culex quinquefasciatus]
MQLTPCPSSPELADPPETQTSASSTPRPSTPESPDQVETPPSPTIAVRNSADLLSAKRPGHIGIVKQNSLPQNLPRQIVTTEALEQTPLLLPTLTQTSPDSNFVVAGEAHDRSSTSKSTQHAIIESSTSPVNAVHPVDQLDAKHHSTEALPMQKGRKVYTKDDEDTVHDRRELPSINTNVANQVEADATSDVTEACEDPWPDADIPGLASPSTTSGTSSSSTNGCNDVINTGSLTIELPHVSSQLHKPVSCHHLRNFNCSPASGPKHANLFCNDQLIYAVFQVLVANGTSSAPRTTPSHRPRLRPRTRWKLDNASFVAPIIITGRNGPHHRSWSITSSLFLDARVVC